MGEHGSVRERECNTAIKATLWILDRPRLPYVLMFGTTIYLNIDHQIPGTHI